MRSAEISKKSASVSAPSAPTQISIPLSTGYSTVPP